MVGLTDMGPGPRADDLPCFVGECDESEPCTHNPSGAMAAGRRAPSPRAGGTGERGG